MLDLLVLCDGSRAELHEQAGQRRAAGSAIEPEHNGVVLGVISRLEEPCEVLDTGVCMMAMRVLTVEEVLVLLVVVEVTRVLLDLVDAEHAGVDLLGPQAVLLELAVNLALLLAVLVLDPDALDVGALDDVVPFTVLLARVRLGLGEESSLLKALGEHHGDLVPNGASLASERLEALLEVLERLAP